MELRNTRSDTESDVLPFDPSEPIEVAPFPEIEDARSCAESNDAVVAIKPSVVRGRPCAVGPTGGSLSVYRPIVYEPGTDDHEALLAEATFRHGVLAGFCGDRECAEGHASSEPTARAVAVDGTWFSVCPDAPGEGRSPATSFSAVECEPETNRYIANGLELARAYIEADLDNSV